MPTWRAGAHLRAARHDSRGALTQAVDRYLGLFWAFVGIMIILGAILAFAVIYVAMAVNVVERTNELATVRTAGVRLRRVAGTLATENLLATALGIPLGLILGVLAATGVLLAAALSQWPAARAVRRLDIARIVRERAT